MGFGLWGDVGLDMGQLGKGVKGRDCKGAWKEYWYDAYIHRLDVDGFTFFFFLSKLIVLFKYIVYNYVSHESFFKESDELPRIREEIKISEELINAIKWLYSSFSELCYSNTPATLTRCLSL